MRRLLYLDNLKVCLTVLVIFHHAGQAYGDGGGWAYTPSNPAEVMPQSMPPSSWDCSFSSPVILFQRATINREPRYLSKRN